LIDLLIFDSTTLITRDYQCVIQQVIKSGLQTGLTTGRLVGTIMQQATRDTACSLHLWSHVVQYFQYTKSQFGKW
jgi:hypothetical protein